MSDYVFNNDGFGPLVELAKTGMTEQDAIDVLVRPLAESDLTALDWCIMTTAEHNCRTRHGRAFDGIGVGRDIDQMIGRVVAHYNGQDEDLLDLVVKHGHDQGIEVYGNVRLSHCLNAERVPDCPGVVNFCHYNSIKKDFRSWAFHAYLIELFEDILEKGIDGISLDFERKAPFFPPGTPEEEKLDSCLWFMRKIRKLTDRPVIVRVAHEEEKGRAQGQDPITWMKEGLVDVVIPGTHNHEPDSLDWTFDRFLTGAKASPRPCKVWPQVWPTGTGWEDGDTAKKHTSEAVILRTRELIDQGADGVYSFNFCCYGKDGQLFQQDDRYTFSNLKL